MKLINYAIYALLAAPLVTAFGCGSADSTGFPVSGHVTFKGAPIPRGTVTFIPDSTQGNSGPAVSADIIDGKFDTADGRFGMKEGAYRVQIYGYDGNAKPELEIPLGRALFNEFRTNTNVTQDNSQMLDFAVSK